MRTIPGTNTGVTLIELLVAIAALAIVAVLFLSFGQSRTTANLQLCATKLEALRPLENQCLEEIRSGADPCPFCRQFNSQLTALYAGACKDLDVEPATYMCPRRSGGDD